VHGGIKNLQFQASSCIFVQAKNPYAL